MCLCGWRERRVLKDRFIKSLISDMKGRNVSVVVKTVLRNSIFQPTPVMNVE